MQARTEDKWEGNPIRNAASVALARTRSLDVPELEGSTRGSGC